MHITRWEQELYFRELKSQLGLNDLLQSQTPETAAQEVAAMIIGSSLMAEERSKLKPGEELSHRISFIKMWETLEPFWLTLILGADILTETQKQQLCERFYWLAARRVMQKKRTRSCPRAMRQPIQPGRVKKIRRARRSRSPFQSCEAYEMSLPKGIRLYLEAGAAPWRLPVGEGGGRVWANCCRLRVLSLGGLCAVAGGRSATAHL